MKIDTKELSNEDIKWEASYAGITPVLIGNKAKQLYEMGDQAILPLISKLSDRKVFVAAHVLLTKLSGIHYQSFPAWNGLVVNIASDGTVDIDLNQQSTLADQWQRWYSAKPRPEVLPPGS